MNDSALPDLLGEQLVARQLPFGAKVGLAIATLVSGKTGEPRITKLPKIRVTTVLTGTSGAARDRSAGFPR
jgi:hypothetical protein